MSTRPNREKVAATIKKVFSTHASPDGGKFTRLLYKHESEGINCYCIEGVFCEAATQLGYGGKLIVPSTQKCVHEVDKRSPHSFSFFADDGYRSIAPEALFSFLGLPPSLKIKDLSEHGLDREEILRKAGGFYCHTKENLSWNFIHDCTETTLKQLIDVALAILSKK